jgi:hypothetical protein
VGFQGVANRSKPDLIFSKLFDSRTDLEELARRATEEIADLARIMFFRKKIRQEIRQENSTPPVPGENRVQRLAMPGGF